MMIILYLLAVQTKPNVWLMKLIAKYCCIFVNIWYNMNIEKFITKLQKRGEYDFKVKN